MTRLEVAFAEGALVRTPEIDQMLADLRIALEQDEGQKLGGKSAEAARFITRALARMLEERIEAPVRKASSRRGCATATLDEEPGLRP